MNYVRIWNELRMIGGQIYVLEIKKRSGEITDSQLNMLESLHKSYDYWERNQRLWDEFGEAGFDGENPKLELLDGR